VGRIGAGRIAADAIVLGPRTRDDDAARAAEGLRAPARSANHGRRRVARRRARDRGLVPAARGRVTDFAADPSRPRSPARSAAGPAERAQHVDHYAPTMSLGYRTDHTATNFGLELNYGRGHGLAPHNLDFTDLVPQPTHQLGVYVLASSSYEF